MSLNKNLGDLLDLLLHHKVDVQCDPQVISGSKELKREAVNYFIIKSIIS